MHGFEEARTRVLQLFIVSASTSGGCLSSRQRFECLVDVCFFMLAVISHESILRCINVYLRKRAVYMCSFDAFSVCRKDDEETDRMNLITYQS